MNNMNDTNDTNLMNRYQHQRWIVRLGRWLRWKPWFTLWALWLICHWWLRGAYIPNEEQEWFSTRHDFIKHFWICAMSLADVKMSHVYTTDEILHCDINTSPRKD